MDKIILRDLRVVTTIGTLPAERRQQRELLLNLELELDLNEAGTGDDLARTVNYQMLERQILQLGADSRFRLIERFAAATAELCLSHAPVMAVEVTVVIPGALAHTRSVAVKLRRERNNQSTLS